MGILSEPTSPKEDGHVHLKEMIAVPVRCSTCMATRTRAAHLQTPGPREAERTATAAALRTHARTPCRCILRWVHNAHLRMSDDAVVSR